MIQGKDYGFFEGNVNIYSWRKKNIKNNMVLALMANLKDI